MKNTGERIKKCRIQNGFTQEEVAKHLGIGKQAVYKYETGAVTNIPLENIALMGQLFNVDPCYLAGWSDVEPSPILTPEEEHLVSVWRDAEPAAKKFALRMLEDSAEEQRQKKEPGTSAG